ncbi:MCE family protein [Rudanella paleaurantiibacter]|uniref:MCE family protein n=1 Tax=Rudanella paleaurantiibacter TaxID=2614655 RepID=A0A7J5U141_9BACT|nr:MlaD family protein [Rudanella paleaurantiibacter]KAB7731347.1 MCE family protein [Rudanella paleaurantiibacter]
MKAADNKRSITVGLFVLIGIIIFIGGVLFLGGQQKRFVKTVMVKAIFDDVGGLKVGNNVWFSGVKVGTVRRISFFGNSQVEVDMNIEEKSQAYIRKDAQATISSDGLIGNKIVMIVGGSPRVEPVEDGDRLAVRTALSSDQLLETLQENNNNLLRITTDVKNIIGQIKQGKGVAGAVLTDSLLAYRFESMVSNLQQASGSAAKASGSLSAFAAKLNDKRGLPNQLVSDTAVYSNIRLTSARLRDAANMATEVTDDMRKASDRLNSKDNLVGLLLNDPSVNNDVRGTLSNLNQGTKKLDENMEALQHNFLLRGFFRRRAKEKEKAEKAAQTAPADSAARQANAGN